MLTLAVFICRKVEGGGVLNRLAQLLDLRFFLLGDHVDRLEAILGVHPKGLVFVRRNEVANVSDRGLDSIVIPEETGDGSGLGR